MQQNSAVRHTNFPSPWKNDFSANFWSLEFGQDLDIGIGRPKKLTKLTRSSSASWCSSVCTTKHPSTSSSLLLCNNAHNFNRMKASEHEWWQTQMQWQPAHWNAGAECSLMDQQCRCRLKTLLLSSSSGYRGAVASRQHLFALPTDEPMSSRHASLSSQQLLRSAGFFCGRPCDMELVTTQYERPGHQQRLLQTFADDVFIFSLPVYIAHYSFLYDALYKFTYLLTYLLWSSATFRNVTFSTCRPT